MSMLRQFAIKKSYNYRFNAISPINYERYLYLY